MRVAKRRPIFCALAFILVLSAPLPPSPPHLSFSLSVGRCKEKAAINLPIMYLPVSVSLSVCLSLSLPPPSLSLPPPLSLPLTTPLLTYQRSQTRERQVTGRTQPGFEPQPGCYPRLYLTRCGHSNHLADEAVVLSVYSRRGGRDGGWGRGMGDGRMGKLC